MELATTAAQLELSLIVCVRTDRDRECLAEMIANQTAARSRFEVLVVESHAASPPQDVPVILTVPDGQPDGESSATEGVDQWIIRSAGSTELQSFQTALWLCAARRAVICAGPDVLVPSLIESLLDIAGPEDELALAVLPSGEESADGASAGADARLPLETGVFENETRPVWAICGQVGDLRQTVTPACDGEEEAHSDGIVGRLARAGRPLFVCDLADLEAEPEVCKPVPQEEGADEGDSHGLLPDHALLETLEHYSVILWHDGYVGVPHFIGPIYLGDDQWRNHPAILQAQSRWGLNRLMRNAVRAGDVPEFVEDCGTCRVYRYQHQYHAIPRDTADNLVHPAAHLFSQSRVAADTLDEVRAQIDSDDSRQTVVKSYRGHTLIARDEEFFAVSESSKIRLVSRLLAAGKTLLRADSVAALETLVDRECDNVKVEYAGWLPAFEVFGNCGTHPLFSHINKPPEGYTFTQTKRPLIDVVEGNLWKKRLVQAGRAAKVATGIATLAGRMLLAGVGPATTTRFLKSRYFWSQIMLPSHLKMAMLTSVPYTYSQQPWCIEIEDITTLFFPQVHNGQTQRLDLERTAWFKAVRTLLESRNCRGIVTHMRSTAEGIEKLFAGTSIPGKTHYAPMGVQLPDQYQRHEPSEEVRLLFTNSWHQAACGFYLRGGLDVLEAYSRVKPNFPNLRLIMRTRLPENLPERYRRMIDELDVQIIDQFLPMRDLQALLRSAHVYVLPAARIHIMSVLQAMSLGLVPLVSDGWGMEEYVTDGQTGVVVEGRYGVVSWQDEKNGMLREDYQPMYRTDSRVVQGLIGALANLARNPELRQRLGKAARTEAANRFNLDNWNSGLARAFDSMLNTAPGPRRAA